MANVDVCVGEKIGLLVGRLLTDAWSGCDGCVINNRLGNLEAAALWPIREPQHGQTARERVKCFTEDIR